MGSESKAGMSSRVGDFPIVVEDFTEQDEKQVVKACQQGDQDAFAILVHQHQRRVFNLCLRVLRDYDDANEITQEAFVLAWQGLPTFRGEARFSTWLYRIAYRCSLRHLEKRNQEYALHEALQTEQCVRTSDQETDPEAIVEKHEQQALLRLSLERLPTRYRLILILRDFQELTYQEIASSLALPMGTIKTQLFRARQLLKRHVLTLAREPQR